MFAAIVFFVKVFRPLGYVEIKVITVGVFCKGEGTVNLIKLIQTRIFGNYTYTYTLKHKC